MNGGVATDAHFVFDVAGASGSGGK